MYALRPASVPQPLRRYLEDVRRRHTLTERLNAELATQRRRLMDIENERRTAIATEERARAAYLEAQRKWATAVELARRIRVLARPGSPREAAMRAELERSLATVARELGTSSSAVLRAAG
ncbi:MAG TPA: hypothetical protein VMG99_01280 [Thermoplasmata archaeon]|nr:hypothetical protein [Thermoplasmata archaeon]